MMKFTMNAKELKAMMDKSMSTIYKKCPLTSLTRLYFQVDENGTVKIWGTDLEHYAEVRSKNAYMTSPGILGIDIDDIKIISKMNGDVTLEDVTAPDLSVSKINIKCGKKIVTIPRYANTDVFLPTMDETESKILSVKENWLLETITDLSRFTVDSETNKVLSLFNFNTKDKRVEALDGHRIGMRSLKNQTIYEIAENKFNTVKIHNRCVPVFKKLMDKKSSDNVVIYQDNKYIRVEGKDFTYVTTRIDCEYFDVSKMLNVESKFKFIPKRENILSVMKYNADFIKTERKPVILHTKNKMLYTYMRTAKYEMFDEIEVSENDMSEDLYIGLNPYFLADTFEIVDSENPVCTGYNEKTPLIINGNEYSFVILPINIIREEDLFNKFEEKISKAA